MAGGSGRLPKAGGTKWGECAWDCGCGGVAAAVILGGLRPRYAKGPTVFRRSESSACVQRRLPSDWAVVCLGECYEIGEAYRPSRVGSSPAKQLVGRVRIGGVIGDGVCDHEVEFRGDEGGTSVGMGRADGLLLLEVLRWRRFSGALFQVAGFLDGGGGGRSPEMTLGATDSLEGEGSSCG